MSQAPAHCQAAPDAPAGESRPLQRDRSERQCKRPGCPNTLQGRQTDWCSEYCRWKVWDARNPRQKALPLDPEPQPVPQVQDHHVPIPDCEGLKGDNAAVLRRLRQGPATTYQLHEAAPDSLAIHSRVSDVRQYLIPLGETVKRRRVRPRLHLYQIEAKR